MIFTLRLIALLYGASVIPTCESPRSGDVRKAIILEFENRVKGSAEPFGKLARDAVEVELSRSARYEVISGEAVGNKAIELGLSVPFDAAACRKLADALGADVLVDGKVDFMKSHASRGQLELTIGIKV